VPFYERHGYRCVRTEEASQPVRFEYCVMRKTLV
jgi:hypothetical protein